MTMKKVLILMVAIIPLIFSGCTKRIVDTRITISGTVIDYETQMPLKGVSITVTPNSKNKVTGSDGYFEFIDLAYQQYTIIAQKNGYSTDRKNITSVVGDNVEVTFMLKKIQ